MNKNSFYANRLKIILSCYSIQTNVNEILKALNTLPDGESSEELKKYVKSSKVMRFKPYLEKVVTDIRLINP